MPLQPKIDVLSGLQGDGRREGRETVSGEDRSVPSEDHVVKLDWVKLLDEFTSFELGDDSRHLDPAAFEASLLKPAARFVEAFIEKKLKMGGSRNEIAKALYFYLLQKRYEQRLNLLHFAFHIFDEHTHLPDEVINQTPFPHEDGIPSFRHFNEPGFDVGLERE